MFASEDGKLSILNPGFTGTVAFTLEYIVIILQWIFEIWPSNYWLRGNIFAIFDHMYGGL
jgi:hypothetical protein